MGRHAILVSGFLSIGRWSCRRLRAADGDHSGGDDNLLISVAEYDPYLWSDNVQCYGTTGGPGIVESCSGLADRMDASESFKFFGPSGQPHDYATPYILTAGKKSSSMRFSMM